MTTVRLDTRHDLVEARALYTRHGYREVDAFSASPYADHWFEKRLGSGSGPGVDDDRLGAVNKKQNLSR